jgi:hypothetical protein
MSIFSALKNSFSLAGAPEPEIRLAVDKAPPTPPVDAPPPPPLVEQGDGMKLDKGALLDALGREKQEAGPSPAEMAMRAERSIQKEVDSAVHQITEQDLEAGNTEEDRALQGVANAEAEGSVRTLGDKAQDALRPAISEPTSPEPSQPEASGSPEGDDLLKQIEALVPEAPPPPSISERPDSDEGENPLEAPLPKDLPLPSIAEEKEPESNIDIVELPSGKKVQVLERDEQGRPVRTFDMEASADEEDASEPKGGEEESSPIHKLTESERAAVRRAAEAYDESQRGAEEGAPRRDEEPSESAVAEKELSKTETGREVRERRPSILERLSNGAREAYKAATDYFERDIGGRAMALYHDAVRNRHLGVATRAQERFQERRDKVKDLEEQVEQTKGSLQWLWYQDRLKRARIDERDAERKSRAANALMEHHAERQNDYLRIVEGKLREKMRPFEEIADRERERNKSALEAGSNLGKIRHEYEQELARVETEAKDRRGLFMSHEWRQKVGQARQKLRDIDGQIRGSEREAGNRNARLLKAEAKADKWRAKIDELVSQSQTEVPEFNIPEAAIRAVPGQGSVTRERVVRESSRESEATSERGPRFQVESFVSEWNKTMPAQKRRIDEELFQERLAEHLEAEEAPAEATMDELMKVAEDVIKKAGGFDGVGVRKRNNEMKARRTVMESVLR